MPPEKLLSCPFCGIEPQPYDGNFTIQHSDTCILRYEIHCGKQWFVSVTAKQMWQTRTPSSELVEALKDKERLDFYFGNHRIKGNNALIDMEIKSLNKNATPDEWRTAIDAAMREKA